MNRHTALLDSLRGSMSKNAFVRRVGITHRALNYIESGERRPGRKTIERLLAAFPERSAEIVQTFLSEAN